MPRTILRSTGYACRGAFQALREERNLMLFAVGYGAVLLLAARLGVSREDWIALFLVGGLFAATELGNTALERLTDVIDDHLKQAQCTHCYFALRAAKDIAAAASLVSLIVVVAVVLVVLSGALRASS